MGSIKIKAELKTKIQQGTILTLALREALSILEMPLPALAEWLQEQIEQNPALQFDEEEAVHHFQPSRGPLPETSWIDQIASPAPTLADHLLQQAREVLTSPEDLQKMEELIGNLGNKGFLEELPEDSTLLPLLHTFDPPGIGAKNLQHSLLLQLARRGEQETLAYRLIEHHYDDFIHSRKNLPCTPRELHAAIHTLSCLSLDPAAPFRPQAPLPQTPDIFIESQGSSWTITLNNSLLPRFKLNSAPELSRFEPSARWTQKMISRRGEIITAIVKIVLDVQNDFFLGKTSDLQPLSFKHVAQKLSLHESTISRAVKEKILSCPRGIYPLRLFFPHASAGSLSHHTVKERIKAAIDQEDKQAPLSDEQLAAILQAQGIPCARRTVTKYRKSLAIASARLRCRLS